MRSIMSGRFIWKWLFSTHNQQIQQVVANEWKRDKA